MLKQTSQFFLLSVLKTRPGVIVLTTMIIVGAILTIIAVVLLTTSTNTNKIRLYQSYSQRIFFNADSCAEEALVRLDWDSNYIGEILALDVSTCTITVSGTGTTRTITASVTNANDAILQLNIVRTIQIGVTVFPTFTVTSWQEV